MGLDIFKNSAKEFKSVRNISLMALLMALKMIFHVVATIRISQYVHVAFGFLVFIIVGTMFGPVVAALFGFLSDILCFYLLGSDGVFHWGFNLSSVMSAVLYSLFLYKFKLDIPRVLMVQVLHDVFISTLFNTFLVAQMYFKSNFYKAFMLRLPKECISLVINCILAVLLAVSFKKVVRILKLEEV